MIEEKDNVLTVLDNYGKMAIVEIYINTTPKAFENKSLFESGLKEKYNLNLMMSKRKNTFIEVTRNTVIQKKDIIVVFGLLQTINDLFKLSNKDFSSIVEEKTKENIVTLIDNYGDNAMAEIVVNSIPEMLDGTTLENSKIKLLFDINILTIKRNENVVEITRDTIIEVNDIITVFGSYKSIRKLFLNIE